MYAFAVSKVGGFSRSMRVRDRVVDDVRLLQLGGRVLEESARIAEDERRRALARTVANGIADGDVVEVDAVVARALIALEPPHVQVLARLSHPQPGSSAGFARCRSTR
ncbi:MAG TPA: hypothetical protein VNQ77_10875 [Frankiaceae bacterium]|nr:hypothetical protein [Frankiaceae bacterium]